jgi:hypothetical protein
MEDKLVGLLSKGASTPDEAFAKVKIEEGFGQALDLIYRISSREESENGMAIQEQGNGERTFVRSRRERNRDRHGRGEEEYGIVFKRAPNSYGGN